MERLQVSSNEKNRVEPPNESQPLKLQFEEVKEERVTMDGLEVITILKCIGAVRSEHD